MKKIKLLLYILLLINFIILMNVLWCTVLERLLISLIFVVFAFQFLNKLEFGKSLLNIIRGKIVGGGSMALRIT